MREFRFQGTSAPGETVRGNIFAPSRRAAWRRVGVLSEKHAFKLERVETRRTFMFKVQHPSGRVLRGEQKAYSTEEVRKALGVSVS